MKQQDDYKHDAWVVWLISQGMRIDHSRRTLEHTSLGKHFSGGWDAAIKSVKTLLECFWFEDPKVQDVRAIQLSNLPIGVRAYNALKMDGVKTVGDLLHYSERYLLRIPNMGRKSVKEVKDVLSSMGLQLKAHKELKDVLSSMGLELKPDRPNVIEGSLDSAPAKKLTKRMKEMNAYANECRNRRLAIYNQWKYDGKTVRELAELHGVTPGRIHQILKRAERDRSKREIMTNQMPSLESIKAAAMQRPIPPWLREDQVNEPNND